MHAVDSTCNWKCLAEELNVCHDNLNGIEATKRIYDIILEHQKHSEEISTVRALYCTLEAIGANRAAYMLACEAYKVCKLPRKRCNAMLSRSSAMLPRSSAMLPLSSAMLPRSSAMLPRSSAMLPRSSPVITSHDSYWHAKNPRYCSYYYN